MTQITNDSEAPAKGQQIITVCALVHKKVNGKNKLLLAKRADTKKLLPGVYEFPGGHIDYGENLVSGLKREFKEEFNVDISVGDPFAAFTYNNDIKGSHSIEVVYFAKLSGVDTEIVLNPEDHSKFGWFSIDELDDAYNEQLGSDDIEFKIAKKGLSILAGESPNFG